MRGDDWVFISMSVNPNISEAKFDLGDEQTDDLGMPNVLKPKRPKPAAKAKLPQEKLPSMAELKRRLAAGADTAVAKAMANTRKLIGRDIL